MPTPCSSRWRASAVALAFVFGALFGSREAQVAISWFGASGECRRPPTTSFHPGFDGARRGAFLPPKESVYLNLEQYLALFMLVVIFIFGGPIRSFVGVIGNGICQLAAGFPCI
jgi:hypothetical protein